MSEPFVGEVKMTGYNFAPRNFAFCNGAQLLISQNPALFSIVGTIYGGDGRNTFNLPNLSGRAPMHAGTGPGLSPHPLGQRAGNETVTLSDATVPVHTHNLKAVSTIGDTTNPSGNALAASPTGRGGYGLYDNADNRSPMSGDVLASAGSGSVQGHENMQPFQVVSFVIALQGIFPQRN